MPPSQADRVRQLEDDAADMKNSLNALQTQVDKLVDFQADVQVQQSKLTTEVVVLRQRLDEQARRFDRSEMNPEALLKDVAAMKQRNEDLHKRIETLEPRIWGGAVVLISALVAVVSLILAIVKK